MDRYDQMFTSNTPEFDRFLTEEGIEEGLRAGDKIKVGYSNGAKRSR